MNNRNVFDILEERGFISQATHPAETKEMLGKESVTFYIGYDPTADSLTIGGMATVMAVMHMQRAGHKPIILLGGGTGMIGDPTDKMETRKIMTREQVEENVAALKKQIEQFVPGATYVNNADWLMGMNYIQTLREVCIHFSVNRMLTADAFRTRFEREAGLTLFELNYMVLQAYDFLELNRRYGCVLQIGGQDQWSNIIAGVDILRRVERKSAFGLTFALIEGANGEKMGKSLDGAVYLDAEKTSPYQLFQYMRNVPDGITAAYLKIYTFLPVDEINEIVSSDINHAKKTLAYETTKLVHGEDAANEAQSAASSLFGKPGDGGGFSDADISAMPTTHLGAGELEGLNLTTLLVRTGLAPSNREARQLVQQGGITLWSGEEIKANVPGQKQGDAAAAIAAENFAGGFLIVRKGKKVYHRVFINV